MPRDPRLHAWRNLLAAHAAVIDALEAEMRSRHGISLGWYEVLLYLHEAEGHRLRMHELAESLLLSRSAATRFVDRMQVAGLVEREPDPDDGRGTLVSMTPAGRARFAEAGPFHLDGIRRHFAVHLDEAEAGVLAAVAARVSAALGRPRVPPG